MTTTLRNEGLEFLEHAPNRWAFEEPVAASQHAVFAAISADPSTWSWYPGITSGRYHGDPPHGVGSKREVLMAGTAYRETMLAWDAPVRWAYRVDSTTVPLANALVEDWEIFDRGDHSVVRWTFAIDPRPLFKMSLRVAPTVMGKLFARAMRNLSAHLNDPAPTPDGG